jgi:proliferating cell nuclear antigen
LIDKTSISINENGLKLNGMDDSHVAMLLGILKKEMFISYECNDEFLINVDVRDVIKILRRGKKSDNIRLIGNSKKNDLTVVMESTKSKRNFHLKFIDDIETDKNAIKIMEDLIENVSNKITVSFDLDGPAFQEIVQDALIISDLMLVRSESPDSNLFITANSEDVGELEVEIESKILENYDAKEKAEGLYSLNFLESMMKLHSTAIPSFRIGLGDGIPLMIIGDIIQQDEVVGHVKYFLAPRVENEDDYEDDEYDDSDFENELEE